MSKIDEFADIVRYWNSWYQDQLDAIARSGQYDRQSQILDAGSHHRATAAEEIQKAVNELGITRSDLTIVRSGSQNDSYMDLGVGNLYVYPDMGVEYESMSAVPPGNFRDTAAQYGDNPNTGGYTGNFNLAEKQDSEVFDEFMGWVGTALNFAFPGAGEVVKFALTGEAPELGEGAGLYEFVKVAWESYNQAKEGGGDIDYKPLENAWQDVDVSDIPGDVQVQVPDYQQPPGGSEGEDGGGLTDEQQGKGAAEPAPRDPVDTAPPNDPSQPSPNPDEIGEVDSEHVWVYVGNGVFVHKDTGERKVDSDIASNDDGFVVGGRYSNPQASTKEDTTETTDDEPGFDWGGFWDWYGGGPNTGGYTTVGDSINGTTGSTTDGTTGQTGGNDSPTGGSDGTAGGNTGGTGNSNGNSGDGDGDGDGDGNGDGTGDGSSTDTPDINWEIALGLLPFLMQPEQEKKNYTGNAFAQDTSTKYEKPVYDAVTQKPLLQGQQTQLQAPMVKPAANSGQDSFEEWYEDYIKSDKVQNGLLPMIAPKRKSRGLI